MRLTLRYSPQAKEQINAYLDAIDDKVLMVAAIEELRREIEKLLLNPSLGTAPTGPFEFTPIHQFRLRAGGAPRMAHLAYRVTADTLDVLLFSAVATHE